MALLSGCAKQFVCADNKIVSDPSLCVVEEKEESKPVANPINNLPVEKTITVEQPKAVEKEIDSAIQKLFDKAKKFTNYEYEYTAPKNVNIVKVSVMNNSMRLNVGKRPERINNFQYTDVFFEKDKKNAVLMCLQVEYCDNTKTALKADYDSLYIKTVMELIDEVTYAKVTGDEMVNNKDAYVVNYKLLNGEEGRMWIDKWYGTPLKKSFTKNDEVITEAYSNFLTNVVKELYVKISSEAIIT